MFNLPRSKEIHELQLAVQKKLYETVKDDWHKVVTETAGFVPLEVRFQRLFENGVRVQLRAQEFDSVDMRKLYLDDEFRVEPDDELEDIEVKLQKRQAYLNELKSLKANANNAVGPEVKTSEAKPQKSASDSAPRSEDDD